MKRLFLITALSTFVFAATATTAISGNWYLGGGLETASIEVDGADTIDDGSGITFSFGYRFVPSLALDFLWGASSHQDVFGGDVAYGRFSFGPKFILTASDQFQPYLTVGIIGNVLQFDFFQDIDGSGLFFGIGADFFINSRNSIGLGIRGSSWTGEDSVYKYDMKTSVVSVVYNYHFLRE
jgi:hypothetical protein